MKSIGRSVVILETDPQLDHLRAFLPGAVQTDKWQRKGTVLVQTEADGTATGLLLKGYKQWAYNRMVLTDLIASTLHLHRDQVVDDVNALFREASPHNCSIPHRATVMWPDELAWVIEALKQTALNRSATVPDEAGMSATLTGWVETDRRTWMRLSDLARSAAHFTYDDIVVTFASPPVAAERVPFHSDMMPPRFIVHLDLTVRKV